jgi:hypothetical protein
MRIREPRASRTRAPASDEDQVPTERSRFAEPVPGLVTTPVVALLASLSRTWAGVRDGLVESTSAAAPATCGDAIDVPLIVLVAVFDEDQSEVMDEPGAKMSRQVP